MTNKPKNIGTATETAVVRYLRVNGFPNAERRALAGIHDLGDIVGTPGIVWEVKGGKAAETASDAQIDAWVREADIERINAKASLGILVCKRKAVGSTRVGEWWAWLQLTPVSPESGHNMSLEPIGDLGARPRWLACVPVRLTLADAVRVVRWWGYGDEPETVGGEAA